MLNALLSQTAAGHAAETERHAYNAAFEELGLSWYWDAATYSRLQAHGRQAVRMYLETEQAHLLRAYEADFLVKAIETARARYPSRMLEHRPLPAQGPNGSNRGREETRVSRSNVWASASAAVHSHRAASAVT
jgi:hypothetical protein